MTRAANLAAQASNINASGVAGVAAGGTASATLTANNVLLGNGTSAIQAVAPGTSGNILTSNGTTWVSSTPAGGGVTSLNGQTGTITNTDLYAIGGYIGGFSLPDAYTARTLGTTYAGSNIRIANFTSDGRISGVTSPTGTYRFVGPQSNSGISDGPNVYYNFGLFVRVS